MLRSAAGRGGENVRQTFRAQTIRPDRAAQGRRIIVRPAIKRVGRIFIDRHPAIRMPVLGCR
jgi:hypothetical protein